MTPIAVIDFETTGLSPAMGDRATEVAIKNMHITSCKFCITLGCNTPVTFQRVLKIACQLAF